MGAFAAKLREAALVTLAIFTSGLVFGRVVSVAVDGTPGTFVWLLLAGELIIAVTAWLLLRRGVKPQA